MNVTDKGLRVGDLSIAAASRRTDSSGEIPVPEVVILSNRIRERVRLTWPQFDLDLEPFVERVLSLLDRSVPATEALNSIAVEDLFLAHCCGSGDERALRAFTRDYEFELKTLAQKLRMSKTDLDDIRQILWDKLFLDSPNHSMKILDYRGTGRLQHWFRVLAARTILDENRRVKRSSKRQLLADDNALWTAVPSADPELENIRHRYKTSFRAAFESAVATLEPAERNMLRCHYLMGMSTEQLAQVFGIHKATAARQVARVREKLFNFVRDRLKTQMGADSQELDSVMRLFDGELSVSLSRLLE